MGLEPATALLKSHTGLTTSLWSTPNCRRVHRMLYSRHNLVSSSSQNTWAIPATPCRGVAYLAIPGDTLSRLCKLTPRSHREDDSGWYSAVNHRTFSADIFLQHPAHVGIWDLIQVTSGYENFLYTSRGFTELQSIAFPYLIPSECYMSIRRLQKCALWLKTTSFCSLKKL